MCIRLSKILALFLFSPSFAHAHSMAFTAIDWNSVIAIRRRNSIYTSCLFGKLSSI